HANIELRCYDLPHLPPFPTRRSSDLEHVRLALLVDQAHEAAFAVVPRADGYTACLPDLDHDVVAAPHELRGSPVLVGVAGGPAVDRKSTRLNSSHVKISYAVFCLKK